MTTPMVLLLMMTMMTMMTMMMMIPIMMMLVARDGRGEYCSHQTLITDGYEVNALTLIMMMTMIMMIMMKMITTMPTVLIIGRLTWYCTRTGYYDVNDGYRSISVKGLYLAQLQCTVIIHMMMNLMIIEEEQGQSG